MDAHDGFATLVALRAKGGELTALRALSHPEQLRQVQPLLQFDPLGSAPASQLDAIEVVIRDLRRLGRHVMLDASEVADLPAFGTGPTSALGQMTDRLADPVDLLDGPDPIAFIPVVRSDAADQPAVALGRLCHELGAGCAFRIRSATAGRDNIERIIERLDLDTDRIDLILDLQYIGEATTSQLDEAAAILAMVTKLGEFRSVSLLSGSIPRTLAQTSTWEQPRTEETLWANLVRTAVADLRLGDYGAVHPVPGGGFRSNHVAMKYTCPDHWLYSRERMPEPDDHSADSPRAGAFRIVCRHLIESDNFAGPDFSWGDHEIHEAATGRGRGFGDSSKPVALATSHHLAYLAGRSAA